MKIITILIVLISCLLLVSCIPKNNNQEVQKNIEEVVNTVNVQKNNTPEDKQTSSDVQDTSSEQEKQEQKQDQEQEQSEDATHSGGGGSGGSSSASQEDNSSDNSDNNTEENNSTATDDNNDDDTSNNNDTNSTQEQQDGQDSFLPDLNVTCDRQGSGNLYDIGPGEEYETLGSFPWYNLSAGDTVRIHWKSTPYHEKILIQGQGTAEEPIVVCGVKGPNGERPIIDGDGATGSDNLHYFSWDPIQDHGLLLISRGEENGYYYRPENIIIESLHLRGANHNNQEYRNDGSVHNWMDGSACIYVLAGKDITLRDNVVNDCGNGIFVLSKDEIEETLSRNILIEGNQVYGNGVVGDYLEHNLYIQALGVTVQYNYFGDNREGAEGGNFKDRSAGTVVRYNWIEGGARMLDLVDAQEHVKAALADPRYRKTYVYGNVLIAGPEDAQNPVHYGGDTDGFEQNFRKGTLYFYDNTVILKSDQDQVWDRGILDLSTNDETAEFFNNIVYLQGTTMLRLSRYAGVVNLGINWINTGWVEGRDPYTGTTNGDENMINGTDPMLDPDTLIPLEGSPVIDMAQSLPEEVNDYQVEEEYASLASHQQRNTHGSAADLGAFESG